MKRFMGGFSLVEIMIAVVVVGIIAVVAVPAYQDYVRYGDTSKCAKYIIGSRLNATNLIMANDGDVTGIDATALGLLNTNNECSGGITVAVNTGVLSIAGDTGAFGTVASSRTFTMTRAAVGGAWSCTTTDSGGNVIQTGSCTSVTN